MSVRPCICKSCLSVAVSVNHDLSHIFLQIWEWRDDFKDLGYLMHGKKSKKTMVHV